MQMSTDTQTVASLLCLKKPAEVTPVRLSDEIKQGFSISAFNGLLAATDISAPELRAFITSERSYQRRIKRGSFSTTESERIYRAAMVWALAEDIYEDKGKARQFLMASHPLLEGRRPLELASDSIAGYEAVEGVLLALKYGTAA